MRRWLIVLATLLVAAAGVAAANDVPRAWAGDAPIGHIGDTLRVDTGTYVADVTVSSVVPVDPPPGFAYTRSGVPVKSFPDSSVTRADVTVRAVRVPNSFILATNFSFTGVTPFADAYKPRPCDASDWLDAALGNAPQGSIVRGGCTGTPTATRCRLSCCWTRKPASTSHSGTFDLRLEIATADVTDADELAAVAARTFPLACPPAVAPEHIASFVDANLSSARFAEYLTDPRRAILTARHDGRIVGYAMLIRGDDRDVELSKLYLLPGYHGTGAAAALMHKVLATAADWGALRVWLGVNQKNQRAQRFYAKTGFKINGTRTFRLGAHHENDYVMVRELV